MSAQPKPRSEDRPDRPIHRKRTAEQLAAEQGIGPLTDLDTITGSGDDLWASDAEFEEFLAAIDRWRHRDRVKGKP